MKTNIYKYLILKKLPTKIKNYTIKSSPNIQLLSTLFCPYLLNTLQICSTRSFSDVWFMMILHYINTKQKLIKLLFCQMQINIVFRYSPHPLRSLILHIHTASLGHSPHHSTHCMWIQDFKRGRGVHKI